MSLTDEKMNLEAENAAEAMVEVAKTILIEREPGEPINWGELFGEGVAAAGEFIEGVDENANVLRFLIKVCGKSADRMADLLPLLEEETG